MTKTSRVFELLAYMRESPGLNSKDLARLLDVSERGIFRYIDTLRRSGHKIESTGNGYILRDDINAKPDMNTDALLKAVKAGLPHLTGMDHRDAVKWLRHFEREFGSHEREMRLLKAGEMAETGGELRIGHMSRPDPLNPIKTINSMATPIMNLIYAGLVRYNAKYTAQPDLALSWEVDSDYRTWTFRLRQDVVFHDGNALTAEDVVHTFNRILSGSPKAAKYDMLAGVEMEDRYTVRFDMKHPCPTFLALCGQQIIRHTGSVYHFTGCGPYVLEAGLTDVIMLKRNPLYFKQGRPILDRLTFRCYEDSDAALEALEAGDIDMALDIDYGKVLSLKHKAVPVPNDTMHILTFNMNSNAFRRPQSRWAVCHAIDRGAISRNQLRCASPDRCTDGIGGRQHSPEMVEKLEDFLPGQLRVKATNTMKVTDHIYTALKGQMAKVGVTVLRAEKGVADAELRQVSTGSSFCEGMKHLLSACESWHSEEVGRLVSLYEYRAEENTKADIHAIIYDKCPACLVAPGRNYIASNIALNGKLPLGVFLDQLENMQVEAVASQVASLPVLRTCVSSY